MKIVAFCYPNYYQIFCEKKFKIINSPMELVYASALVGVKLDINALEPI